MDITLEDIPQDTPPPVVEKVDFNPEYPGSTPEAPYGYKPDGTPYKRRPRASGTQGRGNMPASNSQATQAAALLARANLLVAMVIGFAGMPNTAAQIEKSNGSFEMMARDALLTDPQLCRKILSSGSTSGKAGLAMAYAMFGGSLFSTAKGEIRELRRKNEEMEDED